MEYFKELSRAMDFLGQQENSLFLGQAVEYEGTAVKKTLAGIDKSKLLEVPIFEDSQIGMSIGLSLAGFVPINIMPRFNFTLLACNQIVNHLDKYKLMSDEQYIPKVIIRTVVGSEKPLFPGHQHIRNFSEAFRLMCDNIEVIEFNEPEQILPAYIKAYDREDGKSTLLVEFGDYYNSK